MALSEMPRCSVSSSFDLATTLESETRCLSLRSASTLCLTRSTVRWRSFAYTFSSSQGYGSGSAFSRFNLDEGCTFGILSESEYRIHLTKLQIARAQELAHLLR